jgi:hypothetical protein
MLKHSRYFKPSILFSGLIFLTNILFSQVGFDNPTRALYIFDLVAQYVNYGPGFADSSSFKIGVLLGDYDLINEMGNLAKTRTKIQDKPVSVMGFRKLESLAHTQVLYVNKNAGFDLEKIKAKIAGKQTMLITEGYEFRESMINFIVVDGKPQYDINEDYIKKEGMSVPQTLLFTAIKTKEDWQNLFDIASKQIEIQKETIRQQLEMIDVQKQEILKQKALLDSLDKEIASKEKALNEKQKLLNYQVSQINKQQGEISVQKKTILVQQQEVQVQKDTLANQKEKINLQILRMDEQLKKITDQEGKIKMQLE